MNRTECFIAWTRATLLAIAIASLFVVAPAGATVRLVANQNDFDDLNNNPLVDGEKVIFAYQGTLNGTINIVGLQDVSLVVANHAPPVIGSGLVGIGGSNFVPAAATVIEEVGSTCINVFSSHRIRIVGFRLNCETGIHIQDSEDVQVLGNKLFVRGGIRIEDSTRSVVASNRFKKPLGAGSPELSYGLAVAGGVDNLLFDNIVENPEDLGLVVDSQAQRTATINNRIHAPNVAPSFGIWDEGDRSCLLRNTSAASDNAFVIGCGSSVEPELIGNVGTPPNTSTFCGSGPGVNNQNDL